MNARSVQLEVGARSETGHVRSENQDRMVGTQVPLGRLYIVADGMGGHKGGAKAAELTVQGLQQHLTAVGTNISVSDAIRTAFVKTNETVYQQAHSGDSATEGMGSTAVLLLISGPNACIAHVGDSRAYLFRNGHLRRLTTDHTRVQKMIDAGMITTEEARDHPDASVLERALGNKASVNVEVLDKLLLTPGDGILLCSDGLSGYAVDREIRSILQSSSTTQEIPDRLVQFALQKGGEDNVTVQFIQYGPRPAARYGKVASLANLWPTKKREQFIFLALLVTLVSFGMMFYSSFEKSATNGANVDVPPASTITPDPPAKPPEVVSPKGEQGISSEIPKDSKETEADKKKVGTEKESLSQQKRGEALKSGEKDSQKELERKAQELERRTQELERKGKKLKDVEKQLEEVTKEKERYKDEATGFRDQLMSTKGEGSQTKTDPPVSPSSNPEFLPSEKEQKPSATHNEEKLQEKSTRGTDEAANSPTVNAPKDTDTGSGVLLPGMTLSPSTIPEEEGKQR